MNKFFICFLMASSLILVQCTSSSSTNEEINTDNSETKTFVRKLALNSTSYTGPSTEGMVVKSNGNIYFVINKKERSSTSFLYKATDLSITLVKEFNGFLLNSIKEYTNETFLISGSIDTNNSETVSGFYGILDENGNIQESYTVHSTENIKFIAQVYNGFWGTDSNSHLVNLDLSGNVIWKKYIHETGDPHSNFYFLDNDNTGITTVKLSNYWYDSLIANLQKFNESGEILWESSYITKSENETSFSPTHTYVISDKQGNHIIGQTIKTPTNYECRIAYTDSKNDLIWEKEIGNYENTTFGAMMLNSDNQIVIILTHPLHYVDDGSDSCFIKMDLSGNVLTENELHVYGSEQPHQILNTPDNGFVINGRYNTGTESGIYIQKVDENGVCENCE